MVLKKDQTTLPSPTTYGYRQRVFSGTDAAVKFCSHIKTPVPHYKNTVLIAHNAKGF